MEIIIRTMSRELIDDVYEIEKSSFNTPWSRKSFEDELSNPNAVYFVATYDEKGAGYLGGWVIADQYDINNIAVLPEFRRCGIASELLKTLISFCKENKLSPITLEVRESNEAAQALYKSFGFKPIGTRNKYYRDTGEDAIIMALEI